MCLFTSYEDQNSLCMQTINMNAHGLVAHINHYKSTYIQLLYLNYKISGNPWSLILFLIYIINYLHFQTLQCFKINQFYYIYYSYIFRIRNLWKYFTKHFIYNTTICWIKYSFLCKCVVRLHNVITLRILLLITLTNW